MNNLIKFLCVILIVVILLHISSRDNKIKYTKTKSGNYYRVNTDFKSDKLWAAEMLEKCQGFSIRIGDEMNDKTFEKRINSTKFYELHDEDYEIVGVTVNKGEELGLRLFRESGRKTEYKEIFETLIHELAHVKSISYGHNKEFFKNENFLKGRYPYTIYNTENKLK